jgi:hypothetical protein
MLVLTPRLDPEATEQEIRDAVGTWTREATATELERVYENIGTATRQPIYVTMTYATDDSATAVYRNVTMEATGRFEKNGTRFIVGSGIVADFDAMLAMVDEMFDCLAAANASEEQQKAS